MNNSGSPILARQTAPIFLIFICILIIFSLIILAGLLVKKYLLYKKSEKYLSKEKARFTKKKDLRKLQRDFNLTKEELSFLAYLSKLVKSTNLFYLFKENIQIQNFFRTAYDKLKEKDSSDLIINNFFKLSYKVENYFAQSKHLLSTRQIQPETIVFYITKEGEQFPFTLTNNHKEAFVLEIPDFFFNKNDKPKELEKIPFTFKTNTGLSYTFTSRIIRYETKAENDSDNTKKHFIYVGHTENLSVQVQRHYKRETIECDSLFSPVNTSINEKTGEKIYMYTDSDYRGKLINISGGGCCLKTKLPIRENQHIGIKVPFIDINKPIVGIIKKTRRLSDGNFALHIQFIQYTIEEQNKILAFVYKYDL